MLSRIIVSSRQIELPARNRQTYYSSDCSADIKKQYELEQFQWCWDWEVLGSLNPNSLKVSVRHAITYHVDTQNCDIYQVRGEASGEGLPATWALMRMKIYLVPIELPISGALFPDNHHLAGIMPWYPGMDLQFAAFVAPSEPASKKLKVLYFGFEGYDWGELPTGHILAGGVQDFPAVIGTAPDEAHLEGEFGIPFNVREGSMGWRRTVA